MKIIYTLSSAKLYLNSHPFKFQIFLLNLQPKIQQTKMLVMYQRFVDLFLFGLVWQYSSVQTKYDKGRFKVIATSLQQYYDFEPTFIHWLCFEEKAKFL